MVHGFTAEGFLYAQTLSRLVSMGFKVVAIDIAHHGSTQGLPTGGEDLAVYADLLGRVLDELGVRRAFFAGHSMGGRVVTQLAANEPERALAVILIDAIVGETWDRLMRLSALRPAGDGGCAVLLVADTLSRSPCSATPARPASSAGWWRPRCSATPASRGACWAPPSR